MVGARGERLPGSEAGRAGEDPLADAQRFWDRAARDNALYYVDSDLDYRQPDHERFWAGGPVAVDAILGALGVAVRLEDVVVEIGCGVGRLTRPLAQRAAHVVALDVSAEMIARARALPPRPGNIKWRHGDGRSLAGVPDASADVCFSHVVFQHIPDPAVTLGYVHEIGRVLRPGGWAAFQVSTDPRVHRPRALHERVRWRLRALAGRGPRGQEEPAWLGSSVDLDDLERTATASGLDLERVLGPRTQFTMVLARRRPTAQT